MSKRAQTVVLATALIAAAGVLDYQTGPHYGFSLFYVAPVTLAGWRVGRTPALALAALASLCWIAADVPYRTQAEIPSAAWNGFTRLVLYFFLAESTVRLRASQERLRALNAQLESLLAAAENNSRTDALTGLANRRAFVDDVRVEIQRARRAGGSLTLAYIDLDHFKPINDAFGHARGDEVLRLVAQAIRESVRSIDVPARLGGDEFAILLVEAQRDGAEQAVQRIVKRIDALAQDTGHHALGASVGLVHSSVASTNAQALIDAADQAMYDAKKAGGRRVVCGELEARE